MTITITVTVITTSAIAGRLGRPEEFVEAMLAESERGGVVERVEGGWRLSPSAERRFGSALREIGSA